MPKLIVDLNRYRNTLYGCVRHTDQSLISQGILADKEGYRIESVHQPELKSDVLFVQGSRKSKDDISFSYNYADEESAIKAERAFLELIDEVNNA